ncbi:MAG: MFS transporter [Holosporaceae bacterium]|nr:MAG: MFS transporter [Holosporaceae bacterium]
MALFFFSHIGDKYGRKKSLIISVLVISIPILHRSLTRVRPAWFPRPTFLVILLSVQGLGAAAANSGAAIFLNEHAKP